MGGRAIFDGSDPITGWQPVTQAEVFGNPNWANIEKIDITAQGGAIDYQDHIYSGDVDNWPAQTPRPVDPAVNEGIQDLTEQSGFYQINSGSGAASPKGYNSSSTTVTIVDPRIAARFGSIDLTGATGWIWVTGNYVEPGTITSYDQSTSTIVITYTSAKTLINTAGRAAYSISHHPAQIEVPGQFAWSTDKQTLYAWRINSDPTSLARRNRFMSASRHWIIAEGFNVKRYTGVSACAFSNTSTNARWNRVTLRDNVVSSIRASGKVGIGLNNTQAGLRGYFQPRIERFSIIGYNRGGAFRCGGGFMGFEKGEVLSWNQVKSADWGIRYVFIDSSAVDATIFYAGQCNGVYVHHICARNIKSPHGNGASLYAIYDSAVNEQSFCNWTVIGNWFLDDCERPVTSENNNLNYARMNLYERNITTSSSFKSLLWSLQVGEPGSTIRENIIVGVKGWTYDGSGAVLLGTGGNLEMYNNVVDGATANNSGTIDIRYTFRDNLITKNILPTSNGTTRIVTGNVNYSGSVPFGGNWDGTIDSQMAATLGSGPIGVFHKIA